MKGHELSKDYFFEIAQPIIENEFKSMLGEYAAGFVANGFTSGGGSDILGYDDEISQDHNFNARFCLFVNCATSKNACKQLENKINGNLPNEYRGIKSTVTTLQGGPCYVVTPEQNLMNCLSISKIPENDVDWIQVPETLLREYIAGHIYYDPAHFLSEFRNGYSYFPRNVWLKRISYSFFMLHLGGNVNRMALRGDAVASNIYKNWFILASLRCLHLLNKKYAPYCKWIFKSAEELEFVPVGFIRTIKELSVNGKLEFIKDAVFDVQSMLGTMANEMNLFAAIEIYKKSDFVWTDFNCYGFMQAFHDLIQGDLAHKSPYEGPYDLISLEGNINPDIVKTAWNTLKQ